MGHLPSAPCRIEASGLLQSSRIRGGNFHRVAFDPVRMQRNEGITGSSCPPFPISNDIIIIIKSLHPGSRTNGNSQLN